MPRSRHFRPVPQHDVLPFTWAFTDGPAELSADGNTSVEVVASQASPVQRDVLPFGLDELASAIEAIDELSAAVAPAARGLVDTAENASADSTDRLAFETGSLALTDEFGAATVSLQVRLPELAAPLSSGAGSAIWSAGAAPMPALEALPSQYGISFAAQVAPIASGIHALDCTASDGGNGFAATAADASAAFPMCSCCATAFAAANEGRAGFDDYVLSGNKWGTPGLGNPGGTVTWSIAGAGLSNATGQTFFSGTTVALSSVFNFDFVSVLTQAFAAWSAVANITFVQVADGGGNIGSGSAGYIRICAGFIDGGSNVLARAFYPVTNGNAQNYAVSGDAVFDSGESGFWTASSLLAVATHEIGHAIGLNHTSVANSLMNAFYSPSITTPQADDIAGARAIYGTAGAGTGSVSINDVSITEGNAGTTTMTFTITRTGGTAAFSVNYATANNTATAGSDYVARSGTLSFAAGVNSQTFTITINGDTLVENNETFFVNLSGTTNGATIVDSQGTGAIINDDAGNPGAVAINDVTITEGNSGTRVATFTVTRTGGTAAFNVNYATANNSAQAGSDYVATSGTLSFGANVNSRTLSVTINGDTTIELNETFFVNLSGATNGATITDAQGVGTIINDDAASGGDDYADSRSDTSAPFGAIAGGVATGNLETAGDRDWFRISLYAGTVITVDLLGLYANRGTLVDPYLRLYNSTGTLVALDDDSGGSYNSRLTYTIPNTGSYYIAAGAYNDAYTGTYGINVAASVTGNANINTFRATSVAETFDGGSGTDTVSYADQPAPNGVIANLGNPAANTGIAAGDTYISIENLIGSARADHLTGNGRANILEGGAGADVLNGGGGTDTASYIHAPTGVRAYLASPGSNTGHAAGDTYISIEQFIGSNYDDLLVGNSLANKLSGRGGNDLLIGAVGADILTGDAGRDTFRFRSPQEGGDTVTDFSLGEDLIGIVKSGFGIDARVGLGVGGSFDFAEHYFVSNMTGAADEAGHGQFIFNRTTDQLLWDSDGLGANPAVLIAAFTTDVNLRAIDFDLVL